MKSLDFILVSNSKSLSGDRSKYGKSTPIFKAAKEGKPAAPGNRVDPVSARCLPKLPLKVISAFRGKSCLVLFIILFISFVILFL